MSSNPLRDKLNDDRFAAMAGVEILEVSPGFARARLAIGPQHQNALGLVHGGAMFTLAATTFFAACNAAGRVAVGINMSIACLKPLKSGHLTAVAEEISRSRRLATCVVRLTDDHDHLIATFQGTAYVKDDPFPGE